jgi:alpha-1,2-glucosyltransferase
LRVAANADEWDPKITTFPGLYGVSTLYAKAVWWLNMGDFCSVSVLRSLNVLFALGNVVLCVLLRHHIAPQDPNALLHAVRTAMFPPLFFFAFLFYTDGGATFFVLLMLWLAERVDLLQLPPARGSFMLSALVGNGLGCFCGDGAGD